MKNKQEKARSGNCGRETGKPPANEELTNLNNSKNSNERQPEYLDDGRRIGYTEGEEFHKRVRGRLHQLQFPPAWANDESLTLRLQEQGIKRIIINDLDASRKYSVSMEVFLEKGFRIERGHGTQIALPLRYWEIEDEGKPKRPPLTGLAA